MHQLFDPFSKSPYRTLMNNTELSPNIAHVVIFGIGSHHGNDQLGWQFLSDLPSLGLSHLPANSQIVPLRQPTDLINFAISQNPIQHTPNEQLSSNVAWIFIDACINTSAPLLSPTASHNPNTNPTIHRWQWPNIPATASLHSYCSSHALGILETLRLLESLELLPKEVWIYGIESKYC